MAELADAPDLGSGGVSRAGSIPVIRSMQGKKQKHFLLLFLVCAPWARSNGCKSRTRPDSGKCIAEQQVHREVESEESCKQISGPTDRNHI